MELPLIDRPCNGCTACCTVLAVRELDKGYYTKCIHEGNKCCTVYPKHPQSCRDYRCGWVTCAPFLTEEHRPDRLGAVFHTCQDVGEWLEIFLVRQMPVREMNSIIILDIELFKRCGNNYRGIRVYQHGAKVSTRDETNYVSSDGFLWFHQ